MIREDSNEEKQPLDFVTRFLCAASSHNYAVIPISSHFVERSRSKPSRVPYDGVNGHSAYRPPDEITILDDEDCARLLPSNLKAKYATTLMAAAKVSSGLRDVSDLTTAKESITQRNHLWQAMDALHPIRDTLGQLEQFILRYRPHHDRHAPLVREVSIEVRSMLKWYQERDTKLYRLLLSNAFHKA